MDLARSRPRRMPLVRDAAGVAAVHPQSPSAWEAHLRRNAGRKGSLAKCDGTAEREEARLEAGSRQFDG